MSYKEKVSELAARLRISNDPRLQEESLKVAKLVFDKDDKNGGGEISIEATDMNMAGRLFFQGLPGVDELEHLMPCVVMIDREFMMLAIDYFDEKWLLTAANPPPILAAIRESYRVHIFWK